MTSPLKLPGTGEMAELVRTHDWANTPLGPRDQWPKSLQTILGVLLTSRHPMFLWWGPHLVQFYNDGYRRSLGADRHPAALGATGREFWAEIWEAIGPQIDAVMTRGDSTWHEDHLVPISRNQRIEEVYWTYSYSPVQDDDGSIGGTLVVVQETTSRVLHERRLQMLRSLATRAAANRTESQAWSDCLDVLAAHPHDLPWCAVYTVSAEDASLRLFGQTAVEPAERTRGLSDPSTAASLLPLASVIEQNEPVLIDDVRRRLGELRGPVWPEPIEAAWIVPIPRPDDARPYGVLVAGLSPRLGTRSPYVDFLKLTAEHVSSAITTARLNEHEHRRLTSLAELDRAKTAFFSNVSHEFRTPLTLMLGPTEDALASPDGALAGEDLAALHRNQLRLLKLVNSLLDFARVEAGHYQATLEPTDLATLTTELASSFRSAIERADIELHVDCPPLSKPVEVDRETWEKIVLNLLSNALKFTFDGSISVSLREHDGGIELRVIDTGVGIPRDELPRLFDRFHRVHGAHARTHEGSGIGLALVHELVKIHGGTIAVDSEPDAGSTFVVRLPAVHDPAVPAPTTPTRAPTSESVGRGAASYVQEALRWLPAVPDATDDTTDESTRPAGIVHQPAIRAGRILVADDNADMREYVGRVLADRWNVESVGDGATALERIRSHRPELVITDVMMPGLDGFQLIKALRADPTLTDIPVVMLSARAGDEAHVDGLEAGADDYIVKPFSARELRARVDSLLLRAQIRSVEAAHDRRLADLFRHAPLAIAVLKGPEHHHEFVNEPYCALAGRRPTLGTPLHLAVPKLVAQGIYDALDEVYTTGRVRHEEPRRIVLSRGEDPTPEEAVYTFVYQPIYTRENTVEGIAVFATEITELANARHEAERANRAKDDFLAMLGHELRNPLAPIMTALELIRLRGIDTADGELTVIDRQVKHLVALVNDMLDVSRVASGKIELTRTRIEIADIVQEAVEMASPLLEQRQHHLVNGVPREGLTVDGDKARLAQVVSNLLTNAAKYTEPGGRVEVVGAREDGWVIVKVSDDGIGIEPDMLPRIFQMFTQERQALDRSRGGLGLGLAIVHSLVDVHGGSVTADSAGRGEGATFTIRLPSAAPVQTAATSQRESATSDEARPIQDRERVLIVDDNEDGAQMLARFLEALGYTARTTADGPSALAAVGEFTPDVVLVDIGLPVMDGYELARRLKELEALASARMVAMTGYGQDADRQRAYDAGFDAHLVKPVDLDRLRGLLHELATVEDESSLPR